MERVRYRRCGVLALIVALLVPAAIVAARHPVRSASGQDSTPTFRIESRLVVLHVSVLDSRSRPVRSLPGSAFRVFEDGVPQTIAFFDAEDVPVAVGLVVDHSGSMLARQPMVRAAVSAFAEASRPDDEVFTVIFNDRAELGLPDGVHFTHSVPLVESTLRRFSPGGRTAVYDAVSKGITHLQNARPQQRRLVVLSDGDDNASTLSSADVLRQVEREHVVVDVVSTARLSGTTRDGTLRDLARATGGRDYRPVSEPEVVAAFRDIGTRIRQGYSLGYVSSNAAADGTRRRIGVEVLAPGRRIVVHTRNAYVAPSQSSD